MESKKVQVFTTQRCPYCEWSKRLLTRRGIDYEEVRIDLDDARRTEMFTRSGRTSVPQIFIGERHIGGYQDMVALDQSGTLQKMLDEINA